MITIEGLKMHDIFMREKHQLKGMGIFLFRGLKLRDRAQRGIGWVLKCAGENGWNE